MTNSKNGGKTVSLGIHKDKRKMQLTMEDHARITFPDDKSKRDKTVVFFDGDGKPVESGKSLNNEFEKSQENFRKLEIQINEYNSKITNLDPLYANLKPVRGAIVRCLHREIKKTSGGIYIPDKIPVYTSTANGLGIVSMDDSPWQLSTKAIIVAVAEGDNKFKPGQFVQLKKNAVTPAVKNLNEKEFVLPKGYVHYTCLNETPPSNPADEHFGYLLIDPYSDVLVILPDEE